MTSATLPVSETRDSPLAKALAQALPKDFHYTAWHLSTTPAATEALCYAPALNSTSETRPSKPLKTYCEKHFLAVSIPDPTKATDVLVLALEVYLYTTSFSTTIFVAKADSTGYLHLQSTPQGFSPIRAITVTFLNFLVEHRRRPSKQLVINLFARSQSQYIFPGSVKNNKKHILDDRGLIKWWCKVLNPLLEDHVSDKSTAKWDSVHGFLVIPGLDDYETRAFVPRTQHATRNWSLRHPLDLISSYTKYAVNYKNVSPRCLIPTYPDDPKARFVEELEESTSEKAKLLGGWKTPKTLDQFWDMMAFRQECSSGRMTGFVWLVFEPPLNSKISRNHHADAPSMLDEPTTSSAHLEIPTSSPPKKKSISTKLSLRKRKTKKVLKGPIIPRAPRVKTHSVKYPEHIETPYYYWPEAGRGQVVLDENGYKRAVELLLHLEFKSLEQAISSTSRWISEVNMGENWALPIIGEKVVPEQSAGIAPAKKANDLAGLIQRKRKSEDECSEQSATAPVNTLGGGLLRKKTKINADGESADIAKVNKLGLEPKVNMLGPGLMRRKEKGITNSV
ncbi:hypothetical protein GGS24DRAFT_471786 [Hypoxylon argillaceum]|nr:hypothetical protein GGS24DRAFT_471786 [Hypoxylon argillaceum]